VDENEPLHTSPITAAMPRTRRDEDGPAGEDEAGLDGPAVVKRRDGAAPLEAHVPEAEAVVVAARDEDVGRRRVGGPAADIVAVAVVRGEELPRGQVPVFLSLGWWWM